MTSVESEHGFHWLSALDKNHFIPRRVEKCQKYPIIQKAVASFKMGKPKIGVCACQRFLFKIQNPTFSLLFLTQDNIIFISGGGLDVSCSNLLVLAIVIFQNTVFNFVA